ncbi:hypothetical protein LINGRAHAP2_LOCUS15912 [Linum grandiflorum]
MFSFNINPKINYVSFVHCSPTFLYSLIALFLVPHTAAAVFQTIRWRQIGGYDSQRRAGCSGESRSTALGRRTDCVGESWTSSAISNGGVSVRAAILNGGVGDFIWKIRRFSNPNLLVPIMFFLTGQLHLQ